MPWTTSPTTAISDPSPTLPPHSLTNGQISSRTEDLHAPWTVTQYGSVDDGYEEDPERILALSFGEHRFVIPLDDGSSLAPESAHLVSVDKSGMTSPLGRMWVW